MSALNTKLKLLVDECIPSELATEISQCPGVKSCEIVNAEHLLGNKSTPDKEIVEYADSKKRIVVTMEGRIDQIRFPVCSHSGIIILKAAKRHEAFKVDLFKRFMQSGHRKRCRHAIIKLRSEDIEILEVDQHGGTKLSIVGYQSV